MAEEEFEKNTGGVQKVEELQRLVEELRQINLLDKAEIVRLRRQIEAILTPECFCRCGGRLSEVRTHNGKKYRHCYSCHFDFEVKEDV